ncbi:hypothetical protein FH690_09890, partial [Streptococcus suis]
PDTTGRGSIFFSDKEGDTVAASVMQSGWRIAITPADVVDPDKTFAALDAILDIDSERFKTSVAKTDDPYEEVAFRVNDDLARAVRALKLPGVITVQDSWRLYPAHMLAAQVVGFVGYRGTEKSGVYGLERQYDSVLS